jgi:hypothetical protein
MGHHAASLPWRGARIPRSPQRRSPVRARRPRQCPQALRRDNPRRVPPAQGVHEARRHDFRIPRGEARLGCCTDAGNGARTRPWSSSMAAPVSWARTRDSHGGDPHKRARQWCHRPGNAITRAIPENSVIIHACRYQPARGRQRATDQAGPDQHHTPGPRLNPGSRGQAQRRHKGCAPRSSTARTPSATCNAAARQRDKHQHRKDPS